MPRQFLLDRPRRRTPGAALVSLVLHTALVVPLVLPRPAADRSLDLIDQMVVFLVPPSDDHLGRRALGEEGLRSLPLSGKDGAAARPTDPRPAPDLQLAEGPSGADFSIEPALALEETRVEAALSEIEVDSTVERDPSSAAPQYPPDMLARSIQGSTFVHYVVDTTGRVDSTSIRVIRTTHPAFARAVREALVQMKFRPAVQASRKVRQWVEQSFAFKIVPRAPADTT